MPSPDTELITLAYWDDALTQQSPIFLAPGTGFVEDNFSTDQAGGNGFRTIQAYYIQVHLLLCGLVPNRHGTGPQPGGQGPLL